MVAHNTPMDLAISDTWEGKILWKRNVLSELNKTFQDGPYEFCWDIKHSQVNHQAFPSETNKNPRGGDKSNGQGGRGGVRDLHKERNTPTICGKPRSNNSAALFKSIHIESDVLQRADVF